MPVTMRVPIRADRCSSVAWTGTGKVMVASIDCASSFRKRRSVVTVARPPRTRTDMRCPISGRGWPLPAMRAPSLKRERGSLGGSVAGFGIGILLEEGGEGGGDLMADRGGVERG